MRKKIAIIDDDVDVRDGLFEWLSSDYQVECFVSAEEFLKSSPETRDYNCLLLDLRMPGLSGAELQRELVDRNFSAPIIFMSGNAHQSDVISAWRSGAFDFILKPFSPNDMSEALKKVFSAVELKGINQKPISLPITRREAQVLLLLGKGLQQQEIADELNLTLRTVKMYRAFLKNKLNLNTLVDIGKFCDRYRDIIEKHAE